MNAKESARLEALVYTARHRADYLFKMGRTNEAKQVNKSASELEKALVAIRKEGA